MDEGEDLDIAAAMGFSSFGGAKKRKYDQTNSPKAPSVMDASGANSTQLGVRPKKAANDDGEDFEDTDHATATPTVPSKTKKQPPPTGLADFLARAQMLPNEPPNLQQAESTPSQRVPSATEMKSFGGPSISKAELNALRFGVKNENGDTAYFLPNFVEDPWENMESGK